MYDIPLIRPMRGDLFSAVAHGSVWHHQSPSHFGPGGWLGAVIPEWVLSVRAMLYQRPASSLLQTV